MTFAKFLEIFAHFRPIVLLLLRKWYSFTRCSVVGADDDEIPISLKGAFEIKRIPRINYKDQPGVTYAH